LSDEPTCRWYLLTAKPGQDHRAQEQLENQGYTVYRPLARVPRVVRGKRSNRIESLFPRYLFIHLDTESDNWSPIRSTRGVSGFVRFGPWPSVVPDTLVEYLKANEQSFKERVIQINKLKPDMAVRVLGGAFQGCEGILQRVDGEQRALVLLHFLGRQRPVAIPARLLDSI
jgi:transcriptional antiterminator RfaH